MISPQKTKNYVCPYFSNYLEQNPTPVFAIKHYHSNVTDYAYMKGIAKFCHIRPDVEDVFSSSSFQLADEWVKQIYNVCSDTRVCSFEEITKLMPLDTSPGIFWKQFAPTKSEILSSFYDEIYSMYIRMQEPGSPLCYFSGVLKDELRPIEKVITYKTRLFMTAPIEHYIALGTVSHDFNMKIHRTSRSFKHPARIGLVINSFDFDRIMKFNMDFLTKIMCTDVTGFDCGFLAAYFNWIQDFRFSMMKPEFRMISIRNLFRNLYRDINLTPVFLRDGSVYLIPGHPSGTFNTAIDNTLVLTLLFVLVWILCGGKRDLKSFLKHVMLNLYGDDNLAKSSEKSIKVFNAENVTKVFRKFGYNVTFSDVVEFLGHRFVYNRILDYWFPAFSPERAISALLFKGDGDLEKAVQRACAIRSEVYIVTPVFRYVDKYARYLLNLYDPQNDFGWWSCLELETTLQNRYFS
jgi:hypothetical protein